MKKITYYKNMCEYDGQKGGYYAGQGRYRFGYHFDTAQGYLFECPHGVRVALERVGRCWNVTELTSGNAVAMQCATRTEAIERACIATPAVVKAIEKADEYLTATIQALKVYAEQQKQTALSA